MVLAWFLAVLFLSACWVDTRAVSFFSLLSQHTPHPLARFHGNVTGLSAD
jgi:hypothetical protein